MAIPPGNRHASSLWFVLVLLCPVPLASQQSSASDTASIAPDSTLPISKLATISVTATRTERSVFQTPSPLLVLNRQAIREEAPNGIQDLFRNLPGVDVVGVGPNQGRLQIRGQRGQRILLLENGTRVNNSRRQQDFGELPAVTDLNAVERVEVVRGPGSVLYGTDAIGGVVNQITRRPPRTSQVGGWLEYRYGSADQQNMLNGRLESRTGKLGWSLAGGWRQAKEYSAPAGSYGKLTLAEDSKVHDSGVTDWNISGDLSLELTPGQSLSLRVSRYDATDAGFGYVDSKLLGDPSGSLVRILYPAQNVTRATLGYQANQLGWGLADRAEITTWGNWNQRRLDFNVVAPFGPPFPPTAGVDVATFNYTDIATYGTRVEAAKVVAGRHTLTYGLDAFTDISDNTDSSRTILNFGGPPIVRTSTTPQVPNAQATSGGLFAQAELVVSSRFTVALGARGQFITTRTRTTPGLDTLTLSSGTDGAVVGSVGGTFAATPHLNLVATVGRAFRAPNLVEKYFQGATPEGNGFQVPNSTLQPEQSLNVDLGVKFRRDRVYLEAFYYHNTISDAIRIAPTGDSVGRSPSFQNVNVDRIRDQGIETLAEVRLGRGLAVLGHYTWNSAKDAVDADNPVGDGYASKLGGELAWRSPSGRFFAAYEVRHQGERKEVNLADSPVGPVLPAFTTMNARAGLRLPALAGTAGSVTVQALNLGNVLYSEAGNTSFFRPEPGRRVVASFRFEF
jgi:hemoglobin/transferrin/lactoferrin receptor protein